MLSTYSKAILQKTIEVNKRYERDIQRLQSEQSQIDKRTQIYSKKIEYKANQVEEQKAEITDLQKKNEKMRLLNSSIEQIVEHSRSGEGKSRLSKTRMSLDTSRETNR